MLLPILFPFLVLGLAVAGGCGAGKRELIATGIGFIVAAAVPAAFLGSDTPFHDGFSIAWFLFTYAISLAVVIVLGVPTFLLLRPFRPGHWWSVAAAGGLLGFGVSALVRLPDGPNWHDFVGDGPLGALSTLVFWLVWRYGGGVDTPPNSAGIRRCVLCARPSAGS